VCRHNWRAGMAFRPLRTARSAFLPQPQDPLLLYLSLGPNAANACPEGLAATEGKVVLSFKQNLIQIYTHGDFMAMRQFVDPFLFDCEESLWISRCFLEKGEPKTALKFLKSAQAKCDDPDLRKAMSMQEFCINAQVTGDLSAELAKAEALWAQDNAQSAVTHAYLLLLRLMAAQVYIGSKPPVLRDVRTLIGSLSETSLFIAAHAARWLVLGSHDIEAKAAAAKHCMSLANNAGFPHIGGEAWIMVAQAMRAALAPASEIETAIKRAEEAFSAAQYHPGKSIVRRERIKLGILYGRAKLSDLESLVADFEKLEATRLVHELCSDLATQLQQHARTETARRYRKKAQVLADRVGMGPILRIDDLDEIEHLRAQGHPIAAVEVCDRLLARDLPDLVRGIVLQSKARALSEAGSAKGALREIGAAAHHLKNIGALDHASTLIGEQALLMTLASRDRRNFDAADHLLMTEEVTDFEAGRVSQALEKSIYRADSALRAYNAFRQGRDLDQAMEQAERSYGLGQDFPSAICDQHQARCLQVQGQIHAIRSQAYAQQNNMEAATRSNDLFLEANAKAIEKSIAADNLVQAAGCAMVTGTVELNTSIGAWRHFIETDSKDTDKRIVFDQSRRDASTAAYAGFQKAVELYEGIGLAIPAARANGFLAEVAANAVLAPALADPNELINVFTHHLEQADRIYEQRRVELDLDDPEETLSARQELSKETERLTELALRVFLRETLEIPIFWEWLQKAKARSVSDSLASRKSFPKPLTLSLARAEISAMPRNVALVDWCIAAGQVHIIVVRNGHEPAFERIPISQADLIDRIKALTARDYRSSLAGASQLLDQFADLVAPLAWLTDPETLLALSPMGVIGTLPLQALTVKGTPLIRRNPLVVVPNQLLGLERWRGQGAGTGNVVFGDPTSDLMDGSEVIDFLSSIASVQPFTGRAVTPDALQEALCSARIVHYHGHARHIADDPLASALDLAEGPFTASDILKGGPVSAELVVLGACESGMSQFARGNEPNGLTQAFLLRGVARVISTLWPIEERVANIYVTALYGAIGQMHTADAHRKAVLTALDAFGDDRPDLWAPFVLTGRLFTKEELK